MKVLSVRQPWAHALLHLGKDVENRSWSTQHRGPLAIHASTRPDPAGVHWARATGLVDVDTLPRGVILGVVNVCDVVREHPSPWANPDVYHWTISDPVPLLTPIPWRGVLKVMNLPEDITTRIVADLTRQAGEARTRTNVDRAGEH